MKPVADHAYHFTVWRYERGGWTRDGKSVVLPSRKEVDAATAALHTPCTHEGPCRFPFRQCGRGYATLVEAE